MRYKFTPKFALRDSISNGYRAPSLQQRYFSGIQSYRESQLTEQVFNNESEVMKAFHISPLIAEKATNISVGFISRVARTISVTTDAYLIQIKNRIVPSGVFDKRMEPQAAIVLSNYPSVELVKFYTNAINTRNYGIDLVVNGNWNINKTNIGLTLAGNINRHSIFGSVKATDVVIDSVRYTNSLFGIEERTTLKKDQPGEKIIFSAAINKGKLGMILRNTFFGNTASLTIHSNNIDTIYDYFSSKLITDLSINYSLKS